MSKPPNTPSWTTRTLADLPPVDPLPPPARDRATPLWAAALSVVFSVGAGVCYLAIAVFTVFFLDLVALQRQEILAYLLAFGALVPVVGILIFDVGHARALAGYRHLRERNAVLGRALLALLAIGGLTFIHPLVLLPFAGALGLCWVIAVPLARALPPERPWDFLPAEAVSFLSGRDARALALANAPARSDPLIDGLLGAVALLALVGAFAVGSWLAAREVMHPPAITAAALITYGAVLAVTALLRQRSRLDPERAGRAAEVRPLPAPEAEAEAGEEAGAEASGAPGLVVHNLSVQRPGGAPLLSDISFRVAPSTVVGIRGDSFAGKSLLLRALAAPHDLTGLSVQGHVSVAGEQPWRRSADDRQISTVLVPPRPLAVPGGGTNNLSCFVDRPSGARARAILKTLVHNSDTVARILAAGEVGALSETEQKALALARALFLRPRLYLFDRPEDGAGPGLLRAFAGRLDDEIRLGAVILIVTDDRLLLEKCDKLLMMQNGRVIELAPSAEINARLSAGWARFVTERSLDSEEALDSWICAQFRRDGDDGNRRTVCMIANEMLALACRQPATLGGGGRVGFEFKHFDGHCILRLAEEEMPVSSATLEKARQSLEQATEGAKLSPLARILRDARAVESCEVAGRQMLQVTIATYDPRKSRAPGVPLHDRPRR
ncbi:ATP-binding cassette domain-containing protein [Shimia sp.]|uniref:ATP-binding cassette domain-containing protein n=1 Tax=Shimia sp. TaxID=1954381 RepID=UPI003563E68A